MKKTMIILLAGIIVLMLGCTSQEGNTTIDGTITETTQGEGLGDLGDLSDPNVEGVGSLGGLTSNPFPSSPNISSS